MTKLNILGEPSSLKGTTSVFFLGWVEAGDLYPVPISGDAWGSNPSPLTDRHLMTT
jgi:hypothetical protein